MVRILVGKTIVDHDAAALERIRSAHDRVVLDIGTGDGRYVLRGARTEPSALYVGIDPVADNMIPTAQKARKKSTKGGAANALFVVSSLEQLPASFDGWADELHVGYPWGSLLAAFVVPRPEALARLAALAKVGAPIHVRLNYSVFEDEEYMERLGLPRFDADRLLAALTEARIDIATSAVVEGDAAERSTWERRLVAGSQRKTFVVQAQRTA